MKFLRYLIDESIKNFLFTDQLQTMLDSIIPKITLMIIKSNCVDTSKSIINKIVG